MKDRDRAPAPKKTADIAEASLESQEEERIKFIDCFQLTLICNMEEMFFKGGKTTVNVLSDALRLKTKTLIER